ncbi:MAG: glycosyltransferase family 4 protein [Planctomycetota bacterium]
MTNTGAGRRTERAESSRAPHVVLLNQAFYPDVVATAQMSKDLADHLVEHGYRVTAVASRSIYGKSGAVLPKHETIEVPLPDGRVGHIEVRRVAASLFGKKNLLTRALDFGLFYLLAGARVLTLPRPDVVISFTTPPFIALVGLLAKLLRGSKAVYWLMDLYPDVVVRCGVFREGSLLVRVLERISRLILRRSDAVVVLGRCMRTRVMEKGSDESRVELIPVWADHSGLEPMAIADNPMRGRWELTPETCCVMYSGNFGIAHEAGTICRAMERLRDDGDLEFVFVGGGDRRAEVETFIGEKSLEHARYLDYVPREQLRESLCAGDVHLISVRTGLEGLIVPSKLFGIMAAGRPALYVGSPESEIALVIKETGCGLVVEEGDDEALAGAIRSLAGDREMRERMGAAGREALQTRFDTRVACESWRELIEGLLERRHEVNHASDRRNTN